MAKKVLTGDVVNRNTKGRPRKFTATTERIIGRIVRQHRQSSVCHLTAIYNNCRPANQCISTKTMRRMIHRNGFKNRSAAKKLKLGMIVRSTRLQWCRKHRTLTSDGWSKILFTDEVRIGLRYDGRVKVWRCKGERFSPECTTSTITIRSSIMYWGFISANGTGQLIRCTNRMSAQEYIKVMEEVSIFTLSSFSMIYMDDNAPIHRAAIVQKWKVDNGVQSMEWPPYSPDLNPIENVWAQLKENLNKLKHRPDNIFELDNAVHLVWNSISATYIHRLYDSMPGRLLQCIRARGFPIGY
jgi:hypothetical protein